MRVHDTLKGSTGEEVITVFISDNSGFLGRYAMVHPVIDRLKHFHIKILKSVRAEVANFQVMKQEFTHALNSGSYTNQDKTDVVFEFQAFMGEEVYKAQQRVSAQNRFTFMGAETANEAGHVANLTNQLKATLFEVRTLALAYQSSAGISSLRKCPHCHQVWAKLEGCDGTTTCGNKPTSFDGRFDTLATFQFIFDGKNLKISKVGTRPKSAGHSSNRNAGCGRSIAWRDMAPVQVPPEFDVATVVAVDDVALIRDDRKRSSWNDYYGMVESRIGNFKKTRCQ